MRSYFKQRQLELAMDELARACAKPEAKSDQAKPWFAWMESGDFGKEEAQWEYLAKRAGAELGKAGSPKLADLPSLACAIEFGRKKTSNVFDESQFILRLFSSCWEASGPQPKTLHLVVELEKSRKDFGSSGKDENADGLKASGSRKKPQVRDPGVFEIGHPRLSAPDASVEHWAACCQAAKGTGAASWLWRSAWAGCKKKPGSDGATDIWKRLAASSEALTPQQAQQELSFICGPWRNMEAEAQAVARAGALLCAHGADWGVKPSPLVLTKQNAWNSSRPLWSPVQKALGEEIVPVLKQALETLGPDAFWAQSKEYAAHALETGGEHSAKMARDMACALSKASTVPRDLARLLARGASTAAWSHEDAESAKALIECFEAIGDQAELSSASPWMFPGFALNAPPRDGFDPQESEVPSINAQIWGQQCSWSYRSFDSGRASSMGLGVLLNELGKKGAPLPWGQATASKMQVHPAMVAMFEAWEIALCAPKEPSGVSIKVPRL